MWPSAYHGLSKPLQKNSVITDLVAILGSAVVPNGRYLEPEEEVIARCIAAAALDAGIGRAEIKGVIGMTAPVHRKGHYDVSHLCGRLGLKLDYMAEIDMQTLGLCNALLAAAAAIEERDLPAVVIFAAATQATVASAGLPGSGEGTDLAESFDMTPIAWAARGARAMVAAGEATERDFAAVAVRLRQHGALNPLAYLRSPITVEDVLSSPVVEGPLKRLMISPRTHGAGAIIVASPEFARQRAAARAVLHVGHGFAHGADSADTEVGHPPFKLASAGRAMQDALERTSLDLSAIGLVEPYAAASPVEIMVMRGLGFGRDYARRSSVSPSGGLLSRGDASQATSFYSLHEIVQQLRGEADGRQAEGLTYAMTASEAGNYGACAVDVFARFDGRAAVV